MSTASASRLGEIRREVYAAGELPKADGTALAIVPHTPHPEDGDALRDLVASCAPGSTLEVGCATGLSTLAIAEGVEAAGGTLDHTAIDPYHSLHWGGAGRLLHARAGIEASVTLDERESVVALAERLAAGRTLDVALIDGCHWFECALIDLVLLARIVRPGGVIAIDDTWMPAVQDAVAYATANLNLRLERMHERNGKPRLAVLRVGEIDAGRAWDSYVPFTR